MANIKLTDQFGLDLDAQPAPTSALLKYFQQLPSLRIDNLDLSKVGGLTLDQPAIRSLATGVTFSNPVSLGEGAPALSVSAGAHAAIKIINDADDLPQRSGDMEIPQDTCYVSFGIDAMASANLTATSGALTFGAAPSTRWNAITYSRLPTNAGLTLLEALKQAVTGFSIPAKSSDLADLPAGQILQVAVSGTLVLSGSVELLATANPLASAALPAPLPTVSVSAGGSATVDASCTIETEYEIVAEKLDSGVVRLGWYHKGSAGFTVRAKVSEGISAGIGGGDLFSQVIGLISGDAKADLEELAGAGVPAEQAADIQSAVKAAANRKLEIAVATELSASSSKAATFLYEIVPAALTDESRKAIDGALRGNLGGLHGAELPGVSCVRSLWETVRTRGVELDVNLLGILNFRSIATLSLEGAVLFEPATGSMVITDTATAKRIRSTQVNFGADTQKLRHVLAESFLITAAYHGAKQVAGGASLRCCHNFFELENSTSRREMSAKLQTGVALGLLSAGEAELPVGVAAFGRTLFTVAVDYDEDLSMRMFLDAKGEALPRETYESAGRRAILVLVPADGDDAIRRRPATDDALWRRMSELGQPGIPSLFAGVPAPLVGAITADYTTIQWWAEAMHRTGEQLEAFHLWMARHPAATFDDREFQDLRKDLAGHLRQVAANTREEFGEPWGLIAMSLLAVRRPGARILITGPTLVRDKRRALTAASGG